MPTPDPYRSIIKTTTYDQEYFSASQVNLYIGDVLIDEITGLSISVHQRKAPIFGYNSQLFDGVMKATVMVEGVFEINFKESGYLFKVLERFDRLRDKRGTNFISPFVSSKSIGQPKVGGARRGGEIGLLARSNIERIISGEKALSSGNLKNEDLIEAYKQLTALHAEVAGFNNPEGALPLAESYFEHFENQIWGQQRLDDAPRRTDDNAFDDITLFITYGDFNSNDRINHTARRIDGVHLTGLAKTIRNDGQPVTESYQFLARNFV